MEVVGAKPFMEFTCKRCDSELAATIEDVWYHPGWGEGAASLGTDPFHYVRCPLCHAGKVVEKRKVSAVVHEMARKRGDDPHGQEIW